LILIPVRKEKIPKVTMVVPVVNKIISLGKKTILEGN
jgi:hypothetical protein